MSAKEGTIDNIEKETHLKVLKKIKVGTIIIFILAIVFFFTNKKLASGFGLAALFLLVLILIYSSKINKGKISSVRNFWNYFYLVIGIVFILITVSLIILEDTNSSGI